MKNISIAAALLSAAMLSGDVWAADTYYGAATRALPLQQSGGTARAMGMGSAVTGVSQGSASLLWNPAALSRMTCSEVGIHHNTGLADTIQETAIIGVPLSHGGLAASLGFTDYGSFSGRDSAGLQTGNYHSGDFSGSVGYGTKLMTGLSGGVTLKASQSRFASRSFDAYTSDVGLLWAALHDVDLGIVYSNINLGKKLGGSSLASGIRIGAGWTISEHLLLASAWEAQKNSVDRFQLGAEYLVGNTKQDQNVLALRAGYQLNYPHPDLSGFQGLTLGLGFTITRAITLDYALVPAGELGNSHRLSLTYKFGCPRQNPPAQPISMAPVVDAPVVLKAVMLEDSHFDFDKSTLRPEGMAALKENIELLKDHPHARVRVAGYTSASGTEEYNQLLSERRAAAVESYLVSAGHIAPGRITTIGYGEMRPKTFEGKPDNINSKAAQSNMRVLFEVTVK